MINEPDLSNDLEACAELSAQLAGEVGRLEHALGRVHRGWFGTWAGTFLGPVGRRAKRLCKLSSRQRDPKRNRRRGP